MRSVKVVLFVGRADLGLAATSQFNAIAQRMKLPWQARSTSAESHDDRTTAARIVILHAEALPTDVKNEANLEYWRIHDITQIDREISGLVARLLGGGQRTEPVEVEKTTPANKDDKPKKKPVVRVGRETKGRRGKGVTTVTDVPLGEPQLLELAALLKNRCGTGGTVKDGVIEIQGDQRDRLAVELEKLGYQVKRVGG